MNQKSKTIFKDCYETAWMYYIYLHLGFFYSHLSKNEDLSNKASDFQIDFGKEKYLLREDVIKNSLKDIYYRRQLPDVFSSLILNNSIRGVTMALFEALKDDEIKGLFSKQIFKNEEAYDNFDGALRFIRNTFSHNIRDRIELRKKDYVEQVNYLSKKGKSTINFFFDYKDSPIHLNRGHYIVKIDIDFNQIKEGVIYTRIISEYQSLLFIELCYNCLEFLNETALSVDKS
jgi:hypothetical protein